MKTQILVGVVSTLTLGAVTAARAEPGDNSYANCTLDQAVRTAIALVRARDESSLEPRECLSLQWESLIPRAPMVSVDGRVGYGFSPVRSLDGPYDATESVDWRWTAFVPLDTCSAVWVRSHLLRSAPAGQPVVPAPKETSYYCAPSRE